MGVCYPDNCSLFNRAEYIIQIDFEYVFFGGLYMEQRINELELRYMQQEQTIQELNEIVCRQDLILEHLQREFASLKEQFLTMSPSASRDQGQEEPPPHY